MVNIFILVEDQDISDGFAGNSTVLQQDGLGDALVFQYLSCQPESERSSAVMFAAEVLEIGPAVLLK